MVGMGKSVWVKGEELATPCAFTLCFRKFLYISDSTKYVLFPNCSPSLENKG